MAQAEAAESAAAKDFPAWAKAPVFALDIGTHSIIGIVGVPEGEVLHVLAMERQDHSRRVMIDGQIEDIEGVAATADQVRRRLEERLGISLKEVCVAAAGRSLKTQRASCEIALDAQESLTNQRILELEMGAIQQAEQESGQFHEEADTSLYCVGHSVTRYLLDGYPISTLLNHRGQKARVEIIATFLPGEVVESLHTAMKKIGLAVASMTLEPIAAMNAIIPRELRMLNLALVDIGAGTSDIAVSNEGSVTAYTMATIAGDEITETIVREFLVDFETAEQMKLSLGKSSDKIAYQDILGFSYMIAPAELLERIQPAVDHLATVVSERILEVNSKPPAAVFMVGGGSQLPGLCRIVAQKLTLAENKVAVGGNNYMKKMVAADQDVAGPEFATPIGIALTAMQEREQNGFEVTLNGRRTHIYKSGQMTVMDLLLMNGYRQSQLIGRSGKSVTFELDGRKRVVRGGHSVPAIIRVSGVEANISTPIRADDNIEVTEAVNGADAEPLVRDVVEDFNMFEIFLDGTPIRIGTVPYLNGEAVEPDRRIGDLDRLEIRELRTAADLYQELHLDPQAHQFRVNGMLQGDDYLFAPGDEAQCESVVQPTEPAVHHSDPAPVSPLSWMGPSPEISAEIAPPEDPPIRIRLNGREAELSPKEDGTRYLFVDMLNFVDIDPSKPEGNIVLRLNGRNASYVEPISGGDTVEIYWEK